MIKNVVISLNKYSFLIKQLVMRDFKLKYKRSVLGALWSVLNPLLMMLVMGIVFGQMFGMSNPDVNYLVYLISGLVLFNYYSEASNLAMGSVIGNFPLINKVYIPKYIFPLAKCLFIGINFLLTLIPLFLMIIFSRFGANPTYITWHYILLPYVFVCMFLFTLGVGYILSTVSVFLRDTIYIYSIVVMILQYLTPIMYDVNDIAKRVQFIIKLNPLHYYLDFARTIILHNTIPSTQSFIICFVVAVVVLILGLTVFRKYQDKFIYYV